MAKRLLKHGGLDFCYEASGCGYGIHRQLTALGHKCTVAAPSMIPRKPGERIKTDRRDSEKLALLHRSGDLTAVWVPDTTHEALRDLVRARVDASMHLMRARQQLLAFLLRHGRSYPTGKHWTQRHRCWLAGQIFQEHAHGIVFQDNLETVRTAQQRRDALIERISAMVASWSLGPLVEALRKLRGIDMISAATFIASTGDLSRFESPRLLMGYLGLVPSEHSSGGTIRRGGITKTGNREARRMLIEAAWSYQYPARIAKEKAEILVRLPKNIRDIAWKAQTRLCTRYRSMVARGKKPTVAAVEDAAERATAPVGEAQVPVAEQVLPTQALGPGSHRLVASYPGDPSFGPSKGSYTYTVSQAQGVIEDFFPVGDTVANAPVQLVAQVGFASLGFAPYGGTITVSDITTGSPVVLGKGKVDGSLYGGYWNVTVNVPTPGTHTLSVGLYRRRQRQRCVTDLPRAIHRDRLLLCVTQQ